MQNAVSALEPAVSGDDYAEFDEASVNGVRDADLAQAAALDGTVPSQRERVAYPVEFAGERAARDPSIGALSATGAATRRSVDLAVAANVRLVAVVNDLSLVPVHEWFNRVAGVGPVFELSPQALEKRAVNAMTSYFRR